MGVKLVDLGNVENWKHLPKIVNDCNHDRDSGMISDDIRETICRKCGFRYFFNLKQHLKDTI